MVSHQAWQICSVISAVFLSWGVGIAVADTPKTLTVYSGRDEEIMRPLIEKAKKDLGLNIEVRYGDSTELAIALIEEGKNSRADVFYAQDAGSLGAVAREEQTVTLPNQLLNQVDPRFRSTSGQWVGISGRARVIDYNTELVKANELPKSVMQLSDSKWRGKVGWAPTNGSFLSFVTAMRLMEGDQKTLEWLKAMKANGAKAYPKNSAIVEALGRGEIALGLVNNYYLYRFKTKNPKFPVAIHHTKGDAGSLINVAGLAVLKTTDQQSDAQKFVAYMLKPETQKFITENFYEYPLVTGIPVAQKQLPINQLQPPKLDLSKLSDLKGTMSLIQQAGLL
ncbi:MAG: iron ABC transporter substrate-binding protein [Nostoc sp. DedQUE12a]|nr:iron ABC transporter substrate-binding protein [Nostoc sp. DedQUE12a]